jgi:ABC-type multidrug transport system ATPase subunit
MMTGPAIRVEALRKRFGDVVALDGLDLIGPEGDVLALVGPNGARKTTLVRALTTLLVPDSGRAIVLGRDVVAEPFGVRREIGLAGQFAAIDEILTGRENLEMVGMLYHLGRAEAARASVRRARAVRSRLRSRSPGFHLFGRDAPQARSRRDARGAPARCLPRRADDRA